MISASLIRLTDISNRDHPRELSVAVDRIVRVDVVQSRDRFELLLHLDSTLEPLHVAAVDEWGENTVLERSAEEVLTNFRAFVNDEARRVTQGTVPRWRHS